MDQRCRTAASTIMKGRLYAGPAPGLPDGAPAWHHLAAMGVDHVVALFSEDGRPPAGFTRETLALPGPGVANVPPGWVDRVLHAVERAFADGKTVYLCCADGVGRTGLAARMNAVFADAARSSSFTHLLFDIHEGSLWTYGSQLCCSERAGEVPQVVGHTIRPEPFAPGHRVLFADQGMSIAIHGRPAFLDFRGHHLHWHVRDGATWRATTYPARPGAR